MAVIGVDRTAGSAWRRTLWQVVPVLLVILVLFRDTVWSMISIWLRSETFAHGFLILPISLWLIWERRQALQASTPSPRPGRIWAFGLAGALWLAGVLAQALVVEQLALIAMLVAAVWVMLGDRPTRIMLFPLLFLFFSVPMGEDLVPPMMAFTASFTVEMLRLTGIPVFREGLSFSIPSGNWSVVEACSGVRYLIAAVTLGSLYAYLTYRTLWKRLVFILISIVVPIVANGLRAYMIVMIAHLSDYRLAVGVDHLIYGWLFFGFVMLLLFGIGAIWREDGEPRPIIEAPVEGLNSAPPSSTAPILLVLLAGLWSGLGWAVNHDQGPRGRTALVAPQTLQGWRLSSVPAWAWRPRIRGANAQIDALYSRGSDRVAVHIAQYDRPQQGAEAVSASNFMVAESDKEWREVSTVHREVSLGTRSLGVTESEIVGAAGRLLVWHWDRIGDRYFTNPYLAKTFEVLSRLSFGRRDTAVVVVATVEDPDRAHARDRLSAFLRDSLGELELSMARAAGLEGAGSPGAGRTR